jgi:hypothetical protein
MVGSAQTTENQVKNNNEKQEKKLMSTPKKNTKNPAAEVAKTDGKGKGISYRAFACDEDGNVHEATPEEAANAKMAHITVASKSDAGVIVAATYDCHIRNFGNGNIGLAIRTSDTLDDVEVDNPDAQKDIEDGFGVKNDKITLVGRGNPLGAAFALVQCYRAYGTPFGQAFSHRLVRMELDKDTKAWYGLFVPAMTIAAM